MHKGSLHGNKAQMSARPSASARLYLQRGGSTIGVRRSDPGQVSAAWPGQEGTTGKWGGAVPAAAPGATRPSSPPAQTARAESCQYHGAGSGQRADRQMDTLRRVRAAGWPCHTGASHLCELSHQSPTSLPVPPHSSSSSLQGHGPADTRFRRQHQPRAFPLVDACGLLWELSSSSCTLWPLPGLPAGSREQSNVTAGPTLSRGWSYLECCGSSWLSAGRSVHASVVKVSAL